MHLAQTTEVATASVEGRWEEVVAMRVPWVVGEMAARTLCTTRLSETWIHTTDVAPTVVTGPAAELCLVAGQRAEAADTSLVGTGADAASCSS